MNKKIFLTVLLGLFMLSFTSAISQLDDVKSGECVDLYQYCDDCTYVNLTTISYPNGIIDTSLNEEMTKTNQNFNYTFCNTSEIGSYFYIVCGDKFGSYRCEEIAFDVTSTGGNGSLIFIILTTALAVIFLIATWFVNEEFFAYISGTLFLIDGVFLMINGLDILNDVNTRNLAFIYIGIGMLFTIGAYIYNWYNKRDTDDEY